MGVVCKPLGEQQQVQLLGHLALAGQFPFEQPLPGGEAQAAAQPGIHQNAEIIEFEQPAIGSVVRGGQGHDGLCCRSRQSLQRPKNSSV